MRERDRRDRHSVTFPFLLSDTTTSYFLLSTSYLLPPTSYLNLDNSIVKVVQSPHQRDKGVLQLKLKDVFLFFRRFLPYA